MDEKRNDEGFVPLGKTPDGGRVSFKPSESPAAAPGAIGVGSRHSFEYWSITHDCSCGWKHEVGNGKIDAQWRAHLAEVQTAEKRSPEPAHRHSRQCYDDPGPSEGHPFLICGQVEGAPAPEKRELPRRCYIDLYVPAELAIRNALLAVESMPADVRLTDAVVLLGQAKEKVADFIDGVNAPPEVGESGADPANVVNVDGYMDCPHCDGEFLFDRIDDDIEGDNDFPSFCPLCGVVWKARAEATIQQFPAELNYVNAKLRGKPRGDQSFLGTFLNACLRADAENYTLLRPYVEYFMRKYPADPNLLRAEREQ